MRSGLLFFSENPNEIHFPSPGLDSQGLDYPGYIKKSDQPQRGSVSPVVHVPGSFPELYPDATPLGLEKETWPLSQGS
jgi:hypothetical protein